MSKKTIFIGNQSNDGTGDSIRAAFDKVNQNFNELYSIAGAETGLYFTQSLVDTPKTLIADNLTNAASIIGVNSLGNSLTNKILTAGTGISIVSTGSSIYINNANSSLATDPNPTLSNDLIGGGFRATDFSDPVFTSDLATKQYVDNNSFASSVNLYVSTSGNDARTGITAGRALSYAFRTINKACQVAEQLINDSPLELGPDQKYITHSLSPYNRSRIQFINNSDDIPGNKVLAVNYEGDGTDPWNSKDIRPGQYVKGMSSGAIGFIDNLRNAGNSSPRYEYYDVLVLSDQAFQANEELMYGTPVATTNITIFIESGIYEEQLPIKVPANVSLRGDEFRRVLIRPAAGRSTSKWAKTWFRRDSEFDGLLYTTSTDFNNISPIGKEYGYHYLLNPTDINSLAKYNEQMDVFLMNDQTILRAVSAQGHGGFMVVLDPEGQILTKSPYIQNCSSIARSVNTQTFAGGMFIDGSTGNLLANPVDTTTYFEGTTTISVSGLIHRSPQTPCTFIVNGVGYEIDYVQGWSTSGSALLYLNPLNLGGVSYPNGIVAVNSGTGYSITPSVQFSAPTTAGGVTAQATATVVAGQVTQLTITNPGSGYASVPTVTFIGATSGTPASVTLSSSTIKSGFIGQLPASIDIGTAGYRSALAADFTQLNDLGYGIVVNNMAFSELVSVFTYFCHAGYYAAGGAQIGSSNGATKYGSFAMISEGSDVREVPVPARLVNAMITTATIVSQSDTWGLNTINTTSDTSLYVKNWDYIPYPQSIVTVDHGNATDSKGVLIGTVSYTISNASTITNTATVVRLNLSTAGDTLGSIKAPIPDGASVIIRGNKTFGFSGVNPDTFTRPSTALNFAESDTINYQILNYETDPAVAGVSVISLKTPFSYLQISPIAPLPTANTTTIYVTGISTSTGVTDEISESDRLANSVNSPDIYDNYIFGWNDEIHTITGYTWNGDSTGTITISPALTAPISSSTTVLYAGLQGNRPAEISTRISLLRATGHDFVGVGSGGRETSNIPNDIFGPPRLTPSSTKEVIERGRGRVFQTSTDQDGNFKVGSLFSINQGTGAATLNASISLTGLDGLGFSKGVVIDEFSTDEVMNPASYRKAPVQTAVANHISRRLGLNVNGAVADKLGSGYLDLTGLQEMAGTLRTGGWPINMGNTTTGYIANVQTPPTGFNTTATYYATNKVYVDDGLATKVAKAGDTMSGALVLSDDPTSTSPLLQATTRRFVDKTRQLSTLSDVTLTSPVEGDLLMFSANTLAINTTTTRPIWSATREIINVTNSATSDISMTRVGTNSVNLQIKSGVIINADINESAAIAQSKLALTTATTRGSASGITPAERGVASFDSKHFSSTNGWITFVLPGANKVLVTTASGAISWEPQSVIVPLNIPGNAETATRLQTARNINGVSFSGTASITIPLVNALTPGSYISSSGIFDGNAARTFAVDATTSTNLADKVVARDSNGDVWARIFNGTATSAYYADLAEIYLADGVYTPGTVVVFGGEKEITISTEFMDKRVAGVISTNPAHLMNAAAEGLPVALQGRVPCRVVGEIKKGDLLVSSSIPGVAMATSVPMIGSIIGKALGTWDSASEGVIEVVVGRV